MQPIITVRSTFLLLYFLAISTASVAEHPINSANTQTNKQDKQNSRPNFLLIVTDDQSWEHTSKAGYQFVSTPNFDKLAEQGLYFNQAYVGAPSCTPGRTALLTGKHIWQTETAAVLDSIWPKGLLSYQDILEANGYATGYTGKGWAPGRIEPAFRMRQPTGKDFNAIQYAPPRPNKNTGDLVANFETFLKTVNDSQPFSFWVGTSDPHTPYKFPSDQSRFEGHQPENFLPGVLPDTRHIRKYLAGYLIEIEDFDEELGRLIQLLKKYKQFDNTVIIVTSDNGMPFARAKMTNYEYGVRVPMVIVWENGIKNPGRIIEQPTGHVHIAPTLLSLANINIPKDWPGHSLEKTFSKDPNNNADGYAYSAYERHAIDARAGNITYPRRSIHSKRYSLIRNYFPDRWPAGDPPNFKESKAHLFFDRKYDGHAEPYYTLATAKRPYEELYDLQNDPNQVNNLIDEKNHASIKKELITALDKELVRTRDPVHLTKKDYFSSIINKQEK